MTAITPARSLMDIEELQSRAAVSEATAQKLGANVNFFLQEVYEQKAFYVNGNYSILSTPFLGIDGMEFFFTNASLIDAFMFVKTAGSSGSTSLDLKSCSAVGAPFVSVFSTPPAINYQAGNYVWVNVGSSVANTTAPIFNSAATALSAGTALRCDILSVQGGTPLACGIVLRHQPA